MSRFCSGFLILLLALSPNGSAALRIASWNVQNYLLQNRYVHGTYRFQYPKPELEKAGLRDLLLRSRPDVLLLQEVGSEAFLLEIQKDLSAGGLEYRYRHCALQPDARSGLAVLSRIPFDSVIFHDSVPVFLDSKHSSMPRGIQEINISVVGQAIRIYHVHLKSRFASDSADPESRLFRTAEVVALSRFIGARTHSLQQDSLQLVVGDFNTPFSSPLLDPLYEEWAPIPASDPDGQSWTYLFHRTQSRDRIDGFWTLAATMPQYLSAVIVPQPDISPSDHRLLLLDVVSATPAAHP